MGLSDENKNIDEIELVEHRAMVCMPEDSVEVTIEAKVYFDGSLHTVSKTLSLSDIREAFRMGDDYIADDDVFVLTEKGKAFLEETR